MDKRLLIILLTEEGTGLYKSMKKEITSGVWAMLFWNRTRNLKQTFMEILPFLKNMENSVNNHGKMFDEWKNYIGNVTICCSYDYWRLIAAVI